MQKSKQVLELVEKVYSLNREMLIQKHLLQDLDMNEENTTDLENEISELNKKSILYMAQCKRIFELLDFQGEKSTKKQLKIFIVDNDIQYNRFIDLYLKGINYTNINCYYSGEECIKNLNLKPDIIILNYDFSATPSATMNGLQVLCKINETLPEVKVIMLSDSMHCDSGKVIEAQYVHGITKYILKGRQDIITLKETINSITGRNAYNQVYA